MLAKDLAKVLLAHPEAEVIVKKTDCDKWGAPSDTYYSTEACDANVDIPKVYAEDLMNRPDEAMVIDLGWCIGKIDY